ncbi:Aerotaxis receptor [Tritonibacter multivorans]|uniref:Aerotaxis receptor n=1 Tax=Tritonibacter multivorans TaxID=928856 RepID=A0A0P1GVY7_9RHOB|nr:PAS domain-containing protein [Tritonibacter multivorans]MDA7419279.1 chemotaxis protein [Tritonibacter multivorans]CUH79152.1 Aerotaxis receptor [Tritonibacter multivorans]SFD23716.1 aerotaxis receptor [Tritonibacter multivorans]
MSFVDRRIETRPSSGAAPFELNEVFFSRTDERGVIQASNYVFRRVSHFEWNEIIGAPHKVVRHPDMPKGVFQLMWDTIKGGDTIGAYVKNKSKDGLYYWVFAAVIPFEGGYLSARIKPSSEMFTKIQSMYAELLKLEQNEGISPLESKEILLTWIREHGFEDYAQFATHAMSEELISRDNGLGKKPDQTITDLRKMLKNSDTLLEETRGLIKDFEAMHTIPHNLRVIASRIEPSGGPVTVLSQNYGAMSREMSDWFERNVMGENTNFAAIKTSIDQSLFVTGMTRILKECGTQLQSERRDLGDVDMETERNILQSLIDKQSERAAKGMENVDTEAQRIINACQVMHRHFLGLSSTRVLCKIESARLPSSGETLSDIIDQLGAFQERISQRLEHIAQLGEEIRSPEGE